jgi:hypothetical protein
LFSDVKIYLRISPLVNKWRYSQVNVYIREEKSQVEIFSGKSLHQRTKVTSGDILR